MRTERAGVTMIELLIVMVLGLIVVAGAFNTLISQGEAYGTLNAMAATQQDNRMGIDLLTAELREVSPNPSVLTDSDITAATSTSIQFRALRDFGIVVAQHPINKKITVAPRGVPSFSGGDSILVYVDDDQTVAHDDDWQRGELKSASDVSCPTTALAIALGSLLGGDCIELELVTAMHHDNIFSGAPVRAFDLVTYEVGTWDGVPMLLRTQGEADPIPVLRVQDGDGFELRYFDGAGTEITGTSLDAASRASVRRIEVVLRGERRSVRADTYQDALITDVYLRGS